jgi:uncharacterized protein with HEPN domain
MRKDDLVYVGHALDTAHRILVKVKGLDRSQYDQDENLRLALTHLLQVIGEAIWRVSPELRHRHPGVPWGAVAGMRHRIVHDYLNVDEDVVWRTATSEVEVLARDLVRILTEEG